MATIRLIPSAYTLSSTYLSVSNDTNMYTNIDSTTYATVNHTRNYSTTSYYIYIKGFNFNEDELLEFVEDFRNTNSMMDIDNIFADYLCSKINQDK